MWQFYLAGAEAAFRHGGLVNFQVQYLRGRDALPMTRDYMAETEARLKASHGPAPAWTGTDDREPLVTVAG
jgi:cyclopropane-fatty-acyl-phospholipid synthase